MRNLLSFLTNHSLDKPGEIVKEYDVAVKALGRAEGFDTRLDSAVRVHAARLRSKLAEYYMTDGAADPVLIEMPKGSYHVAWRPWNGDAVRQSKWGNEQPAAGGQALSPGNRLPRGGPWWPRWLCATVGTWMSLRDAKVPAAVQAFWQPFIRSPQAPIIVFSNHRFAGSSATGLHFFREGIDSPSDSNDTYSGTGTVMAVAKLTNLFFLAGRSPRLKRAELLTWDEAKDANLVFVGAPESNSPGGTGASSVLQI